MAQKTLKEQLIEYIRKISAQKNKNNKNKRISEEVEEHITRCLDRKHIVIPDNAQGMAGVSGYLLLFDKKYPTLMTPEDKAVLLEISKQMGRSPTQNIQPKPERPKTKR